MQGCQTQFLDWDQIKAKMLQCIVRLRHWPLTCCCSLTRVCVQSNTLWAEHWSREIMQNERVQGGTAPCLCADVSVCVCVCVSWHYIRGKIQLKPVRGQNIPQRWWRSSSRLENIYWRLETPLTSTYRDPSQVRFISVLF